MNATKRMSVAAVVAAFALLGAALLGGVADAKKKKGGKSVRIIAKQKTIPDSQLIGCTDMDVPPDGFVDCSGNGGNFVNGLLVNSAKVGSKLDGTKLKDVNLLVNITHNEPSDLTILLRLPTGRLVGLYGPGGGVGENIPPTFTVPPTAHFITFLGRLGPTTFDDQAALFANDINSCPNTTTEPGPSACNPAMGGFPDGGGVESFSPVAGSVKPADGKLNTVKRLRAGTSFDLIVFDNDPPGQCTTPGCSTGGPMDTQADIPDTGSASMTVIAKPKGGGGKK